LIHDIQDIVRQILGGRTLVGRMSDDTARRRNAPADAKQPLAGHPDGQGWPDDVPSSHGDGLDGELRRLAHIVVFGGLQSRRLNRSHDETMEATLRRLCQVARARGLRVEQVILLLKDAWRELPDERREARDIHGKVLAGVITQCIEEYYTPPRH
jgi:hypothetical protein